jgi:hypothetical protein
MAWMDRDRPKANSREFDIMREGRTNLEELV